MNILRSGVWEIREAIRSGQISAMEVMQAYLAQIEKWNPKINAFISLNEKSLELAKALDQGKAGRGPDQHTGKSGELAGVPIAIKDNFCTRGLRTTAASKILGNYIPPYSSTVTSRLEAAGAIVIGKTNMDEFAMGSSTETSHFGITRNPWNLDYVPGGSSGGSAAAVAAGMASAAMGTDTGGSIRQPAHFCGLVGLKPTYGRVSRYGIIAYASSLDQAGPLTRTVRDCALLTQIIAGVDERDSTSAVDAVPNYVESLSPSLKGKKIGILKEYMEHDLHPEIRSSLEAGKAMLQEAGATFVELSIPLTKMAVPIYYMVATSEASSNLARYDGVRYGYRADFSSHPAESLEEFYCRTRGEGFGNEVKRRIVLGTYALSSGYYDAYYRKSGQVRRLLREQFLTAFKSCDFIYGPVATTPAFKLGEKISDPLQMYLNDIFTTAVNLSGLPGMTVPIALSKAGLPIGVQLTARHFDEQTLFDAGSVIESGAGFVERIPSVLQ